MTSPAGGLAGLGGFVQAGLEIERSFGVLFEKLRVASCTIAVGALQVRGMIKGHVPILGREGQFLRRFLVLSEESQGSHESGGKQTREEGAHWTTVAFSLLDFQG